MQDGYLHGRNGKKIEAETTITKVEILEFTQADEIVEVFCFDKVVYGESRGVEGYEKSKFVFVEK